MEGRVARAQPSDGSFEGACEGAPREMVATAFGRHQNSAYGDRTLSPPSGTRPAHAHSGGEPCRGT